MRRSDASKLAWERRIKNPNFRRSGKIVHISFNNKKSFCGEELSNKNAKSPNCIICLERWGSALTKLQVRLNMDEKSHKLKSLKG